ncbi:N-(5'-phosphoribosyl)anthranilate isomerase [bioreactor metagenome]|uniref:phosphoribosylanthranilate isomerase n=1 Tax=bioreactor metagenome TaxID=1076179 RepID=A0A645ENC7_9ZZZZ
MLPEAEIWKAFTIRSVNDIQIAQCCTADRILLDNGCGSGKCFDWSVLQPIGIPYILAGGLNIKNLKSAVDQFQPYAVDISSGVETDKVKDRKKILAAVAIVKGKS